MDTSSTSSIENAKCTCGDKSESSSQESDSSNSESCSPKDKKLKMSLTALVGLNLRRNRSKRTSKKLTCNGGISPSTSTGSSNKEPSFSLNSSKNKSPNKWAIKFNCTKKEPSPSSSTSKLVTALNSRVGDIASSSTSLNCCKCTCYNKKVPTSDHKVDEATSCGEVLTNEDHHLEKSLTESKGCGASTSADDASNNEIAESRSSSSLEVRDSETSQHQQQLNENSDDSSEAGGGGGGDGGGGGSGTRGIYGISSNSNCIILNGPWDMHWLRTVHEDCDEAARLARAREMEQGVEPPANYRPPVKRVQLLCSDMDAEGGPVPRRLQLVCPPDLSVDSLKALFQNHVTLRSCPLDTVAGCHTQVDFIHCLVPDLLEITKCSFYWGKMDRYEAERLLDGKPEGTFLLRDSAQEEFLFSVSFRKYGRSLHARIEQWNHKFSFDSHDPGVYNSETVCGLIEHYKDPTSCMFFEPMLTWPLHRNFTFSLQHLCRASIVSRLTYDNINSLQLPKTLKSYLKEYHYRQKVRVERFDDDVQWLDLRNNVQS